MLEASAFGQDMLNNMREAIDLEPIDVVWHNEYFDEEKLKVYIEDKYKPLTRFNFGIYYLITRLVHPAIAAPEQPKYDAKINEVAKNLEILMGEDCAFSPHMFLIYQKI